MNENEKTSEKEPEENKTTATSAEISLKIYETIKAANDKTANDKVAKRVPAKKAAKKAAKKVAAKKVAKKAAKKAAKKRPSYKPDLLSSKNQTIKRRITSDNQGKVLHSMAENVNKTMDILNERSAKRPVRLYTPSMLRKTLFPFEEIGMQNVIGCIGLRTPTAIEMVAPDSVGKTTWIFDFLGRASMMGCYSLYIECENKQMKPEHISRILHKNKKTAALLLNTIEFSSARQLVECDNTIKQTVPELRKRCDENPETKGNPIFVVVDPWSSLKSSAEAVGRSSWGLPANAKKEAPKDALSGSNMGHSKHAQVTKREMGEFMDEYNCVMIYVNHQNERVDMKKSLPSFMTPSETKNDTRIGGRAFRQFCAYRFTLMGVGDIKEKSGDKLTYGQNVHLTMIKNSYGAKLRQCDFALYYDKYEDTKETYGRPLSYAPGFASFMVKRGLLGTTVNTANMSAGPRYTCDVLGCVAVTDEALYAALYANPNELEFVGAALGIEGYEEPVDEEKPPDEDDDDLDEIAGMVEGLVEATADEQGEAEEKPPTIQ